MTRAARLRRLIAGACVAALLATALTAAPAAAYIRDGPCQFAVYQAQLFNGTPRIKLFVTVSCLPAQHTEVQAKLIEDDGAHHLDDVLMSTEWKKSARVGSEVEYHFKFNGNCDTEAGDEEMVAKVRIRYREHNSDAWHVAAWDVFDFTATDYYC